MTKSVAEQKVQITQQKSKYEKQLTDLRAKIGILQTAVDSAKNSQNLNHEKSLQNQKISTESNSNLNNVLNGIGLSGSAKANSRSINAIHRQINNKQSNRHGSQIILSSSQQKTPNAAQISTGVTTGSQKHLHLKEANQLNK